MELERAGSQPSQKGPAEWFTGSVRIDPLYTSPAPARVACASVTFEPGARSAWHTHPLGQTLVVTAGCGWTQCEGGPVVELRAGDVGPLVGRDLELLRYDRTYSLMPASEAARTAAWAQGWSPEDFGCAILNGRFKALHRLAA